MGTCVGGYESEVIARESEVTPRGGSSWKLGSSTKASINGIYDKTYQNKEKILKLESMEERRGQKESKETARERREHWKAREKKQRERQPHKETEKEVPKTFLGKRFLNSRSHSAMSASFSTRKVRESSTKKSEKTSLRSAAGQTIFFRVLASNILLLKNKNN
jgi:hypothetical protein